MRRLLVTTLLGLLVMAAPSFAADDDTAPRPGLPVTAPTLASSPVAAAEANAAARVFTYRRPAALPALYGASALLQGYDAYSTLNALNRGGVEANPLMQGIVRHPAAFIGLKAGVAMMSIAASERMWRNHNRMAAVMTMVASNALMGVVAANNARVLSQVGR